MRYNAKAIINIVGCFYSPFNFNKGYIPLPEPPVFPSSLLKEKVLNIDSLKLEYVQKFIDICKLNGIKLIFCISPAFSIAESETYQPLYQIAVANKIPWFDYHTSGLFLDHPEYFKDRDHLWDKGAKIFSSIFAHDIKECIDTI